jgi:eukaryotic-like serine/threonine-protein kinase
MKAEMVNGSVIGNYRVQQKLNETADFILFSGKTLDTEQEVLLKAMRQPPALIRLALPDFQGRTTRFMQLRHPHLCAVREILRDENAFYIVTEVQRGQPLNEALAQKKQFPHSAAVALIAQLLELLEYLHQQKVNCLDLRPSNLYLSDSVAVARKPNDRA